MTTCRYAPPIRNSTDKYKEKIPDLFYKLFVDNLVKGFDYGDKPMS